MSSFQQFLHFTCSLSDHLLPPSLVPILLVSRGGSHGSLSFRTMSCTTERARAMPRTARTWQDCCPSRPSSARPLSRFPVIVQSLDG